MKRFAEIIKTVMPAFAGMTIMLAAIFVHAADKASPEIPDSFCRAYVRHEATPDVAYKAGADVRGQPVVPADIEEYPAFAPEDVAVPLTADLMAFLDVDPTSFPFNAMGGNDINLGVLTLRGNEVLLNGEPLSGKQRGKLKDLCGKKETQK